MAGETLSTNNRVGGRSYIKFSWKKKLERERERERPGDEAVDESVRSTRS